MRRSYLEISIESFSRRTAKLIHESSGQTVFTEVADCLEALAHLFDDENARTFLIARAQEARNTDKVYEVKSTPWASR